MNAGHKVLILIISVIISVIITVLIYKKIKIKSEKKNVLIIIPFCVLAAGILFILWTEEKKYPW